MAYNEIEISEYDNQPIELYAFTRGGRNWYYTSYDQDINFNSVTYLSTPLRRGNIEATADLGKNTMKVSLSRRAAFVEQFIASSPTDNVELVITRLHFGDIETAVIWRGRVTNVRFNEDGNQAEVTCQPLFTALRRPGLRRVYQATCPHVLYNAPCNVVQNSFGISGTLSTVNGNIVQSGAFSVNINPDFNDTWFVGGIITYDNGLALDRRFIVGHDNSTGTLTLNLPFSGVAAGVAVIAYPGCDHAVATCKNKFSNLNNYGGFPFIPSKNPMDGTSIF